MSKWELSWKWLLDTRHFVAASWQGSHVKTVQNSSSVFCLSIDLLTCPGYREYRYPTPGNEIVSSKLYILGRSWFSIWLSFAVSCATTDSTSANSTSDRDARGVNSSLEEQFWATNMRDELSLSTEKSKSSNNLENDPIKDSVCVFRKNERRLSLDS